MFNGKEFRLCRSASLKTLRVPMAVLFGFLLSACGGGGGGGAAPAPAPAPVPSSPVFTTQPASNSVIVANTTNFDVVVTGSPTPTLQWQFSTNGGANFTDIVGATANSYAIPVTVVGDSGNRYRVIATNSVGTVTSNAATLTVIQSMALPETGQINCFNGNTSIIACAGTGQDGDIKAGVAWPSPRFVVGTGAEADCVTDTLTGLMWVRAPSTTAVNWTTALTNANNLSLCGFNDWRLPNRKELRSLANYGVVNNAATLNSLGFSNVQGSFYWSSSNSGTPAFVFQMNDGHVVKDLKSMTNNAWPVRTGVSMTPVSLPKTDETSCYDASGNAIPCAGTGQDGDIKSGVSWPSPRFVVGTGTEAACVTDNLTGLMWVRAPSTVPNTWTAALTSANNLVLCGFSDWRLSNVNELESLVNTQTGSQYLNSQGFLNIQANAYWSSAGWGAGGSNNTAMVVYFNGGEYPDFMSSNNYIWPVRAGQ